MYFKNIIFLTTFDSEFSYIKVLFTDQNSNYSNSNSTRDVEIEDKINITLVVNSIVKYKKQFAIQFNPEINICKRLWIFVFC